MGTWGKRLFENDFTLDIKDEIESYLDSRMPTASIIREIMDGFPTEDLDEIEIHQLWITIAYTLWEKGYKNKQATQRALQHIDKYVQTIDESTEGYISIMDELSQIRDKLLTDPPKRKRSRQKYVCPWKIGDVFAYAIKDDPYGDHRLVGEYFLFHKVGESFEDKKNTYPIVEIKVTKDMKIPQSREEIEELDYVAVSRRRTSDYSHNNTNILKQLRPYNEYYDLNFVLDEDGELRFYQYELYGHSEADIPKDLVFIGNYAYLKPPLDANYYLPEYKINSGCYWKDIESVLTRLYHGITLKEVVPYPESNKIRNIL